MFEQDNIQMVLVSSLLELELGRLIDRSVSVAESALETRLVTTDGELLSLVGGWRRVFF